jgi:Concanavalin A-like lectin/glucanases superfamily
MADLLDEGGAPLLDEAGQNIYDEAGAPAAVAGAWSATSALPSGYAVPPPAAASLAVPVANTGLGGNWLFALCAWRTPPAVLTTVAVGDDACNTSPGANVWEPLGAPNGTSPPAGNTAASIWYCRNALAAANVYVAPDGPVTAMAVQVLEVSGLGPWATLAALSTGYAGAVTAGPATSPPVPSAQALVFTVLAGDNDTATVTGPGATWTALSTVTATNGTDHASDCVLSSAYQVTSLAPAASWSVSVAQDLAEVIAGVLVTGTAPVAPNQNWPYMQTLAGFGAGAQTPWDQIAWTDLTGRQLSGTAQRGKQYELDSIQAGTVNLSLANNDGALTEGNSASPYAPNVKVYTPGRRLATWPPPPAQNARTYSVWRGFIERWPQSLTPTRYQVSNSVAADVYSLLTPLMRTLAQAEILADQPYAYWPCNDPPGAVSAANLAKGNSQQLQAVQSKYGAGGATSAFNVAVSYLAGDPGCTGWQQASVPAAGTQGWCLYYQDAALPALSGGITIEGWFALNASQPSGLNLVPVVVRNAQGPVLQVRVTSAGLLTLDVWDKLTQVRTSTTISAASMLAGVPVHIAVAFTQTAWTLYVDGGAVRTVTGSCNLANSGYWVSYGGYADRLGAAGFCNIIAAHLAVYGYLLPQSRVISHYYSAVAGMTGQDTSGPRMDRLLGDGNCAFPRIMPAGASLLTGAVDIGGQAVSQNLVNVAESDSSWLMVNSAGYLVLQSRRAGYDLPVLWTFGELQASPLNANSQFGATSAPWTGFGGATASRSTAWSYGLSGGSLLITPDGVTASPYAASERVPVTPGTAYSAQAWLYSPQGWAAVHVNIDWATAGGTYLSTTVGAVGVLPAGVPCEVTVAGRAPAGAGLANMSIAMDGTPPATTLLYAGFAALYPPGEYAYLPDIATDCDPSQLYNDITLSQLAAPQACQAALAASCTAAAVTITVSPAAGIAAGGVLVLAPGTSTGELVTVTTVSGTTIGITATAYSHAASTAVTVVNQQASGVTITASSPASVAAYGDQTLQQTSYLNDPAAIGDQAQWIMQTTGTPVNRVSVMTLDPAANPALWPVVLGLETGQVAQVNRRLQGTQLVISGLFQVMSVAHSEAPGQWKTRVALVPYPGQVLALDDVTRGIPGTGVNVLGW